MTWNLFRYLLSVKCKRKNSCLSISGAWRFREGCLGFKYPFLGFQKFCQRNLFQYNGKEAHSDFKNKRYLWKSKGWHSGESTRLPPMWPGSNPGVEAICGLSLLLVLSLAPRGFSPCTLVSPSPQKPGFPNSNSTRNQVDEELLSGCATSKSCIN